MQRFVASVYVRSADTFPTGYHLSQNMSNDLNFSSNATNSKEMCPLIQESTAAKVGKISASCLLLLLAIVGNSFIAVIIYRSKNMRKTIHYFVVNMACSDLIFPIFVLPRIITELVLSHQRWLIDGAVGLTLCKLVYFFQDVSTAVSIQSLVLITVDRFGAVVFPFRPPLFSTKTCRLLIAATWIIALALHSPYLFIRQLRGSTDGLKCYVDWKKAFGSVASYKSYIISLFFLQVVVPFALLTILYSVIILKVKHQTIPRSASVSNRERRRRIRQERNVLKMALAIVICFGICMAPLNIYIILFLFMSRNGLPCNINIFRTIAFFFFYASCGVNPCVCFLFSQSYRKGLKNILRCGACSCGILGVGFHRKTWFLPKETSDIELKTEGTSVSMKLLRFSRHELNGKKQCSSKRLCETKKRENENE